MEKEIVNQVQKAQKVLYSINPSRNMPRHTNQINKDLKEIKSNHTNNTLTEIKNTREGLNSRIY